MSDASAIPVIWLIDLDPPGELGGKGFYPARPDGSPPDAALMRARLTTVRECVAAATGGKAVVTLHTSPRFRDTFFEGPYPAEWHACVAMGMDLALHPHEERADFSNLYDTPDHLAKLIPDRMARAAALDLPVCGFRSGLFAFHPRLAPVLAEAGIGVDLSSAPGHRDDLRNIDWPAEDSPDIFRRHGCALIEVPLGWDGTGTDLDASYLFNERMDLPALIAVWAAIRARNETRMRAGLAPRPVNFLSHAFGLADPVWRRQAEVFLDHIRRHGGEIVDIAAIEARFAAFAAGTTA